MGDVVALQYPRHVGTDAEASVLEHVILETIQEFGAERLAVALASEHVEADIKAA